MSLKKFFCFFTPKSGNFKAEKIVKIYDKNKEHNVKLVDYIWYFYQSLSINNQVMEDPEIINLQQYIYYDLINKQYM